ncbi:MAG: hypothetical protein ACYC36_06145 [Bellilinea sp.]
MADATLKIVIDAINKGDKTLTDLKTKLAGVEGQGAKTNVVMGKLKTLLGAAGVTGAAYMVGKALVGVTNDWSRYAEEVDKAAHLSGVSTEEMSRLIQAADDFRVSQESLKTSMVMALKNGFEPTIENLADLSDEYNALKTPTEKAELAAKIFGRSYAEMEPLLRQGGDAIRAGTAAIADNLIVTEEAVKNNRKYIAQVDEMGDTWTGFKNTIGQVTVPIATDLLKVVTQSENLWEFLKRIKRESEESEPALTTYADRLNAQYEAYLALNPESETNAENIVVVKDATNDATSAMAKYTDQLLFKIASEGLDAAAALELARKMGLVDENTVLATEKTAEWKKKLDDGAISLSTYNKLVTELRDKINGLSDKEITITYNQITTGTAPSGAWQGVSPGGTVIAQAAGGGANADNAYMWQEHGYRGERFIPSMSGYILSRSDAARALAEAALGSGKDKGNGDVNINVYGADDPQQTANLIGINFRAARALQGA